MYTRIHVYVYTNIHTCMRIFMEYRDRLLLIDMYMCIHIYTCIYTNIKPQVLDLHTYIYVYIHMYMHIPIYTPYTHIPFMRDLL